MKFGTFYFVFIGKNAQDNCMLSAILKDHIPG